MAKKTKAPLSVETLKHDEATRKNIPTAEYQAVLAKAEQAPVRVAMERRNRDVDPQRRDRRHLGHVPAHAGNPAQTTERRAG